MCANRKKKILALKHALIPWVLKPVISMLKEEPADSTEDSDREESETMET